MGKTFSTGLLTNGIWQDASNNIGIGAANSSFKFQVTGTTNLTAALTGTSGTFSSLEVYDNSNSGILKLSRDAGGQRGQLQFGRNNGGSFQVTGMIGSDSDSASPNNGTLYFYTSNSSGVSTQRLIINGTGAATFSSSVQATKVILSGGSDQSELTNSVNNDFKLTNSGNFRIINNSNTVALLTITNAGAATFSSSVTATGLNLANTTNGFVGLRLEGTGTYAGSDWTIYASSTSPSSANDFIGFFNNSTTDGATADYKLSIFKNGNVGIGVTPGSTAGITELAIGGAASNPLISGIRDGASAFYIYSDSGGTDFGEKRNLYTRFITNNTERMRITSDGPVRIGSTTNYVAVGNDSGGVYFETVGNSDATRATRIQAGNFNSSQYSSVSIDGANQFVRFSTANSERMRINSSGSVCINSTSPLNANAKLNINGELWMGNVTAGAGNSTLKYNSGTGLVTFDTSSRIFKKDIVDLEYGLESVLKMQPKKYKWKSNDYEDLGFIADEMYEVVPEIVALADNKVNNNGLKDGEPLSINYDRLVPILVKAIQEQQVQIKEKNNKIIELEQKVSQLWRNHYGGE